MVDPRWLDVIVKFEGIKAVRPSIKVDESDTHLSSNGALSNRQKFTLTLGGAMVMVFFLLMMFVAT
jgi:hypothetical protein